tara:strand:- start:3 stop:107 length:105 start_codon:yes stop_codon:yes gene_type:complete
MIQYNEYVEALQGIGKVFVILVSFEEVIFNDYKR